MSNTEVTDIIYNKYVDTGNVPAIIMYSIAKKVMNNEVLSTYENSIFVGKTSDINFLIRSIAKYNT